MERKRYREIRVDAAAAQKVQKFKKGVLIVREGKRLLQFRSCEGNPCAGI